MARSRRVLCLSSSLLSVGGGTDELGVESTNPEKTPEEHNFNNFLNHPSFLRKKSRLKGISGTRIEPDGWSETTGLPVFHKTGWFARFSLVR
jgi:hypothetical protein